jgi:predicted DNA-binding protein
VPPRLAGQLARRAKQTGKTKSELFRDMWDAYVAQQEELEFTRIQRAIRRAAGAAGLVIESEADIERLLAEP